MYAWRCRAHRVRVAELGGPHPVREGRANCSMRAGRFGVVLPAGESACPHCWPAERDVVADCRLGPPRVRVFLGVRLQQTPLSRWPAFPKAGWQALTAVAACRGLQVQKRWRERTWFPNRR